MKSYKYDVVGSTTPKQTMRSDGLQFRQRYLVCFELCPFEPDAGVASVSTLISSNVQCSRIIVRNICVLMKNSIYASIYIPKYCWFSVHVSYRYNLNWHTVRSMYPLGA